jgi:RNA polymerase sigma factor (sigma-70 family)
LLNTDGCFGERRPEPTIRTAGDAASGRGVQPRTLAHRQHRDAEDVVQEAFLSAFRYLDTFRGEKFRTWLLTIVRNSFLDWLKDNRLGCHLFQLAPADLEWIDPNPSPEAMLLDRVDSETLATLVAQLPNEYREILILREIEDLSYKDIAIVTGVPAGTVMSRLSRAMLALRKAWIKNEMRP